MEVVLSGASGSSSLYLWDLRRGLLSIHGSNTPGIMLKQYRQAPPTKKACITTLGEHYFMVASDVKVNDAGKVKIAQTSKTLAWSLENEAVHSHSFVPYNISAFVGSPCGNYAFGGTQDGQLLTWHTPSGSLVDILHDQFQEITSLSVNVSSELLAVGSSDGLIHVLRIPFLLSHMTEMNVGTLPLHALPITGLAFSSSCNSRLFSCSLDQTFKVWHTETKTCLCTISFPTSLNCLAISPVEDAAFLGGVDGNIYKVNLWDLPENDFGILDVKKSGQLPQICTGHKGAISSIDINLDGSLLISGSDDGTIKVWSTATCQQVSSFSKPNGPVTFVKVLLKPISSMLGTNTKDAKSGPLLSTLSNVKSKTKETIIVKIPETNSTTTKSLTHLKFNANINPTIPIASGTFVADQQLQELTQCNLQEKAAAGGSFATEDAVTQIDKLKQEIEQLKRMNAQWKSLNNEMLSSTLKNFDL